MYVVKYTRTHCKGYKPSFFLLAFLLHLHHFFFPFSFFCMRKKITSIFPPNSHARFFDVLGHKERGERFAFRLCQRLGFCSFSRLEQNTKTQKDGKNTEAQCRVSFFFFFYIRRMKNCFEPFCSSKLIIFFGGAIVGVGHHVHVCVYPSLSFFKVCRTISLGRGQEDQKPFSSGYTKLISCSS